VEIGVTLVDPTPFLSPSPFSNDWKSYFKCKLRATPTAPLNHFPSLNDRKKHHDALPTASSKSIFAILLAI
jgi:hypothetical protein